MRSRVCLLFPVGLGFDAWHNRVTETGRRLHESHHLRDLQDFGHVKTEKLRTMGERGMGFSVMAEVANDMVLSHAAHHPRCMLGLGQELTEHADCLSLSLTSLVQIRILCFGPHSHVT